MDVLAILNQEGGEGGGVDKRAGLRGERSERDWALVVRGRKSTDSTSGDLWAQHGPTSLAVPLAYEYSVAVARSTARTESFVPGCGTSQQTRLTRQPPASPHSTTTA